MDITDWADNTNDIGSCSVYYDRSFKTFYTPAEEDMMIKDGKLVGFRVFYKDKEDVLYLDGSRELRITIIGSGSADYSDWCDFRLEETESSL